MLPPTLINKCTFLVDDSRMRPKPSTASLAIPNVGSMQQFKKPQNDTEATPNYRPTTTDISSPKWGFVILNG